MSRRRISFILVILVLVTAALIFRRPIETWAATQSCLLQACDHYPNIENLKGAPDFKSYMANSGIQCRAHVAYDRFEQAKTDEQRRQEAIVAIGAYTDMLETEQGWAYLPRRAELHAELGEYEEALADYDLFLAHAPSNYAVFEQRGELYAELGRFEEALADLEEARRQAHQQFPDQPAYLEKLDKRIEALEGAQ